jgi:hypothetical protein
MRGIAVRYSVEIYFKACLKGGRRPEELTGIKSPPTVEDLRQWRGRTLTRERGSSKSVKG